MACWRCGADPKDRDDLAPPTLSSLAAISHLIYTNNPPADVEIPALAELSRNGRRRIDALNSRIKNLQATLNQLIHERDNVASRTRLCTSVLSPIRRVPPEIICEIFSWTLPRTKRVAGEPPTGAPWYLGQICGVWRQIALGLPSLWSSVAIIHTEDFAAADFSPLPLVEAQLIRSAHAPLELDFEWKTDEDHAVPFLDALIPHSDRWKSFCLHCCASNILLERMRPAKGCFSRLDSLEIYDSAWVEDNTSSEGMDIFSVAPSLTQVLLTNSTFDYFSPTLLVPSARIIRYSGVQTTDYAVDLLRGTPQLVECGLGFTDIDDGLVIQIITLHHLRRLFLEQGSFLARIAAPKLEYLSCDNLDAIGSFVQRSSCHLTTLVLTQGPLTPAPFALPPDSLISLLQHTPALKNLVLQANTTEKEHNHRVLSAMTVSGSPDDICPNLVFLAYGAARSVDAFSAGVFIAMIRSRIRPDRKCRLSSLRIFSGPPAHDAEDLVDGIQTVMDEGLFDVKILPNPFPLIEEARCSFVIAGN
ncbi:hypothetical protein C8R47DRAFT_657986 [Mycena vitilis]|nr:hypothetical protein C8R47DRAFT_657986 [Mycena vitilis]